MPTSHNSQNNTPSGNAYAALEAAKRSIEARGASTNKKADNGSDNMVSPASPPAQERRKMALRAALQALDSSSDTAKDPAPAPPDIHSYLMQIKEAALATTPGREEFTEPHIKAEPEYDTTPATPNMGNILLELPGIKDSNNINAILSILNEAFRDANSSAPHIELLNESDFIEEMIEASPVGENIAPPFIQDPAIRGQLELACRGFLQDTSVAASSQGNLSPESFLRLVSGR